MAGRGDLETDIERVETVDGKLMVQGAEDGREDTEDGLAWSMAINQTSGKLVFTASGADVACRPVRTARDASTGRTRGCPPRS